MFVYLLICVSVCLFLIVFIMFMGLVA